MIAGTKISAVSVRVAAMLVIVGLLCSLALNVFLVHHLRAVALMSGQSATADGIGVTVSRLTAVDVDGNASAVDLQSNEAETIVYIFRPTCIWCQRNEKAIAALEEQSRGKRRMIALSISSTGLAEYVKTHHMTSPVYAVDPATPAIRDLGLGATPETILVSKDGRVLRKWVGAYLPPVARDVSRTLGVSLPRLDQAF